MVVDSPGIEYDGSTKYYITNKSRTAHADDRCCMLDVGGLVYRYDETQLSDDTVKCNICTCTGQENEEGTDWDEVFSS